MQVIWISSYKSFAEINIQDSSFESINPSLEEPEVRQIGVRETGEEEEEGNPITLRRKNKNATIDFHLKIWFSSNDMFILAKES